jgi:branched-chain amino acid transport system permease protein
MTQQQLKYVCLITAALALPLVVHSRYWMHVIIMAAMYMLLAFSVDLIYGYAGQINLGQAGFYAIGAYTTALLMLRLNLSYWTAMPLAGLTAGLFGLILGIPTLRLRGLYLGITTMGFSEIVRLVLLCWVDLTRGPMGLPGIPAPTIGSYIFNGLTPYYYLILTYLILAIICVRILAHSRVGKAWEAIREDDIAASAMGINIAYYKVAAFSIGAAMAGVAGSFFAVYISFVSPDAFKAIESFLIFAMPAVGGTATVAGPILGALIIYVLPEITRAFAMYRMLWVGALMVIVMVVSPKGLVWALSSLLARLRRTNQPASLEGGTGSGTS